MVTYILQKYILKELLRGFILTAVALTCLMGFGGGVMDMLRSQGITAHEMIKLMIYLIPVVIAYSLPVAALFSTTITYGRLSADNEINACRASGINIYRLLLPAVVLSIIVTVVTFVLQNYTIPNLASKIEQLVKRDIRSLAYLELKSRGYISRMDYALHCGQIISESPPRTLPDGTEVPGQIELAKVAFLRYENDIPVFYGTSKTALILFETVNQAPCVTIHLNQVRAFNAEKEEVIQVDYYPIGPVPIPAMTTLKLKFLPLKTLLTIRKDPFQYQRLEDARETLYAVLRNSMAYEHVVEQLKKQGECRLQDGSGRYALGPGSSGSLDLRRGRDGRIILEGDIALQTHPKGGPPATFTARNAVITASALSDEAPPAFYIELKGVRVTESRGQQSQRFATHERYSVGPIDVPPPVLQAASPERVPIEELLSPDSSCPQNEVLKAKRYAVAMERAGTVGKCIGEIHSRLAYSFSALVLLLLGAGLGVIFRGGHFVSAFGLSFIPMLLVVVLIMTGKQLSTAGTIQMGVGVIWLGLVITAVANLVILGKFLRR